MDARHLSAWRCVDASSDEVVQHLLQPVTRKPACAASEVDIGQYERQYVSDSTLAILYAATGLLRPHTSADNPPGATTLSRVVQRKS